MSQHFTHLHLHTDYSLLDGAISIEKLVSFGVQQGFKALAISDHGNIFGAVKFFGQCKKAGIKPILAMEAYFTPDVMVRETDKKYNHLIIIVQNSTGYKNLCKLIAYSFNEGYYFKPRIDYRALEKYREGLIISSACLGGPIPQLLMKGKEQEAREKIAWFNEMFPGKFYLEVQPEDQAEQKILNNKLYQLSEELALPLLATGDCHYVLPDDREAHEIMLAVQTQTTIDDPKRFSFGDCRVHMRTTSEMLELFHTHHSAVWNSGVIADQCDFDFKTGTLFFPEYQVPVEYTPESYFTHLCTTGLEQLFTHKLVPEELRAEYQTRLRIELDLIIKMGFVGYFLVVSDFIRWAKEKNIPVGPGRGSVVGSLVAWTLSITDVDPIKYKLFFERFLNPERISMPDIDIDFCIEGRERVIEYIREKYGPDKVCQIITFGTLLAKAAIKDSARALGFSFDDAKAITDLIPDQLKITLAEAREQEPKLQELIEKNSRVAKLFDIAQKLEGLTRHASKHAAGIVISPEPISDVLPVYVPSKQSNELVTQFAMTELETLGFLKIDLLGLKNLTLIKNALELIYQTRNIRIDINTIPRDDPATFELLGAGKTSGVFQFESDGIKEVLRRLQPTKFEDLIAVNALYRPGPLGSGMVEDFIKRRHGQAPIVYLFAELEPVLQETYGVMVYQEQVMNIASIIAGYSLGEADILRRAMGKKKADIMAQQREQFCTRAIARNFDPHKSGELFDLMAYFAGYGFNKAHSAAYALIAYQTAYLKAHYLGEFMACLISLEVHAPDTMTLYIQEARELGLTIKSPDINISEKNFTAHDKNIIFGLSGIKNIGSTALESICTARTEKKFTDLLDLCVRTDPRVVNSRVLEHLIFSGACDTLGGTRAQQHAELSQIIEKAEQIRTQRETGQLGLFENPDSSPNDQTPPYQYRSTNIWDNATIITKEKESTGCYLTAHPLDKYRTYTQVLDCSPLSQAQQSGPIKSYGIMSGLRTLYTKKGDKMAFLTLTDTHHKADIVVFPKLFAQVEQWLTIYTTFFVKGVIDANSGRVSIKADMIYPLDLLIDNQWPPIQKIMLHFKNPVPSEQLTRIHTLLPAGNTPLWVHIAEHNTDPITIKTPKKIACSWELIAELTPHVSHLTVTI